MGSRVLHDHHPYGELSVEDVLVKSSNIGMAKIGERLGNRQLFAAVTSFGFGSPTGSGLTGELPGILRPLKKWDGYSTGSIPMGHEIAVTPLQLIVAHAALANGGRLLSPRLVRRTFSTDDSDSAEPPPAQVSTQAIDAEIARWLVTGPMVGVVRRGTGRKAQLKEWTVFGKTGTAQKYDRASGRVSSERHVSSFVCGAPAENPRALVLVMVDEPSLGTHYGGTVAAPHAAAILRQTLLQLGVAPTPR